MKRLLLLCLVLVATFAVAADAPSSTKPLRALMVCGGCCHDYEAQKKILSEGITARANVEWTIVHEGIPSPGHDARDVRVSIYEKPDWWKGYDVVVHNECFGAVADDKFVENIAAAHKAGVPGVFLHCSTHSYRAATTDEWRMAIGMTSHSHEKKRDLEVEVVNGQHPVMIGFPTKWHDAQDELYKNEKVWPNVTPLAKAYGQDTKQDHFVIWVNVYNDTRTFTTTLGHDDATMSDPVYLDLVTRGLLWSCGKLNDDGTPKAGYGPGGK